MKPFEKALSGFNHNIKHKGQLYHIQTEDSGRNNPVVTTLLFLGGNVLASLKASYAQHLNSEKLAPLVRELMESQHKQMLRNLLKGQYDKTNELSSKHWKVGQLDEGGKTDENPALVPTEHNTTAGNAASSASSAAAAPPPSHKRPPLPRVQPAPALPLASRKNPHRPLSPEAAASAVVGAGGEAASLVAGAAGGGAAAGAAGGAAKAPSFEEEGAVFGEDLIAEKRLDELILNYLLREKDKLN